MQRWGATMGLVGALLVTCIAETRAQEPAWPALPASAPTVSAQRYRLENGLEVVLDPTGEDTVTVCVIYHSGASFQPPGWTGLAHLGEHVMFGGSPHARRHFLDELDVLGVLDVNGTTERDRTRYYEVVAREHLERVLFLEADRMGFILGAVDEERVRLQREVILREHEERVDLGGLGLVPGLVASVLYATPNHPYADLFEHREDIEALRLPHAQWFLAHHYAPDNATLVVTGGFEEAAAREAIARWFGPIRRIAPAAEPIAPPEIVLVPVERRLVVEAPVRRDQLLVNWPTPPYGAPEHAALELIAAHLENRLQEALLETHLVNDLSVEQEAYELASEFEVSIVTGRGDGTLAALEALDRALLALQDTLLTPAELEALVLEVSEDLLEVLEGNTGRALMLGRRARLAPDGHWSLAWALEGWRSVTPESLREVARAWLPQRRRLVLSLSATRGAPFEGRVVVDLSLGPDGEEVARP